MLIPRAGFIVKGQPKSYAVNADDHQPHGRRCKLTIELREARRYPKSQAGKHRETDRAKPGQELRESTTQKELFT